MDKFGKNISELKKQLSLSSIEFSNTEKLKNLNSDAIIIIGMGGSGQIGDIIAGLKKDLNLTVPIMCWKNWSLPTTSFKNPLYIFVSFSGNTEETLSGFTNTNGIKAIVASDGKLLKIAKENKIPAAYFKNSGIKPRQGNGLMFSAVLGLLTKAFPIVSIHQFSNIGGMGQH